MSELKDITVEKLIERYSVLLLDAYGVLVNNSGAIAGAAQLIEQLNHTGKSYYLLTNDASRLPQTAARRFQGFGLAIDPDLIITSGGLLKNHFENQGLRDARCVVLGPNDSVQYVIEAGGKVVSCGPGKLLDSGKRGQMSLSLGDEVFYGKYSGTEIEFGPDTYVVLRENDILAVVNK